MNRTNETPVSTAGHTIVTWLTVLQWVSVASALLFLLTALTGQSSTLAPGLPRSLDLAVAGLQLLMALIYFLVIQWTKGWMTDVQRWATGEGTPDKKRLARETKTLRGWILFGQWAPLPLLVLLGAGLYLSLGQIDPALLATPEVSNTGLTPDQLRSLAQTSAVLALVGVGLPSFVINFVVLGWVRRWMTGVADAALEREVSETRLPELASSLGRWFTFFQVLLGLMIAMVLITPLLPAPENTDGMPYRLQLLANFLSLVAMVVLLQASKTFLAAVTPRAHAKRRALEKSA
ncbi:hypothetical protein [Deinococcus peraridilitoris]|uniref:Uncharacterized protein n=1 Tax=Deinococcus peraridilitoris (strain DSM 19664 / LMG 22246 / CIP 109416 / KR-200) TaxID=937777 RepID=L0A206_DEIPD|nr:hypothetical protein [Deinococcus peraridilitoris]AFZ67933.1 hypothetical protein Deipe_2461 [Deinococcus peraridilitoris DSM 19664]